MAGNAALVVRYRDNERELAEYQVRRLLRKQALGLILLQVVWFVAGSTAILTGLADDQISTLSLLLLMVATWAIPVGLVVKGASVLRRRFRLPELAVVVTDETVAFPELPAFTVLGRRTPAEEWPRAHTTADFLPGSGPTTLPRLVFTNRGIGKRRRREVAASHLDTKTHVIIGAVNGGPGWLPAEIEAGRSTSVPAQGGIDEEGPDSPNGLISELIGCRMSSVEFVLNDYLQFRFDGSEPPYEHWDFNVNVWPVVEFGGRTWREGDLGYADAIRRLTPGFVVATSERLGDGIRIELDTGSLVIRPQEDEHVVEVALLMATLSREWDVWRPGEGVFRDIQ